MNNNKRGDNNNDTDDDDDRSAGIGVAAIIDCQYKHRQEGEMNCSLWPNSR